MFPSSSLTKEENEERFNILKKAVDQENERIDRIAEEKKSQLKEYDSLIKRLDDLPKKLQHHVMVPFGNVGFMPGKIVRTNEVMMLIGDGYFVEKSTFEAIETLNRQMETIKKVIYDVESEKKLINDQLMFAQRLFKGETASKDEIEIREEYDEEKEAEFKRNRQKRKAIKSLIPPPTLSEADRDIMQKLEELELLEKENNELDEDESETKMKPPPGVSAEDFNRLIARLDEESSDEEDDDDDDYDENELDSDDLEEEEEVVNPAVLRESNKQNKQVKVSQGRRRSVRFADEDSSNNPNETSSLEIYEPQSIGRTGPILRNADQPGPINHEALTVQHEEEVKPRILPESKTAFSGVFVERETTAPSFSSQLDIEPSTSSEPPKRISKFKAQRGNR